MCYDRPRYGELPSKRNVFHLVTDLEFICQRASAGGMQSYNFDEVASDAGDDDQERVRAELGAGTVVRDQGLQSMLQQRSASTCTLLPALGQEKRSILLTGAGSTQRR